MIVFSPLLIKLRNKTITNEELDVLPCTILSTEDLARYFDIYISRNLKIPTEFFSLISHHKQFYENCISIANKLKDDTLILSYQNYRFLPSIILDQLLSRQDNKIYHRFVAFYGQRKHVIHYSINSDFQKYTLTSEHGLFYTVYDETFDWFLEQHLIKGNPEIRLNIYDFDPIIVPRIVQCKNKNINLRINRITYTDIFPTLFTLKYPKISPMVALEIINDVTYPIIKRKTLSTYRCEIPNKIIREMKKLQITDIKEEHHEWYVSCLPMRFIEEHFDTTIYCRPKIKKMYFDRLDNHQVMILEKEDEKEDEVQRKNQSVVTSEVITDIIYGQFEKAVNNAKRNKVFIFTENIIYALSRCQYSDEINIIEQMSSIEYRTEFELKSVNIYVTKFVSLFYQEKAKNLLYSIYMGNDFNIISLLIPMFDPNDNKVIKNKYSSYLCKSNENINKYANKRKILLNSLIVTRYSNFVCDSILKLCL